MQRYTNEMEKFGLTNKIDLDRDTTISGVLLHHCYVSLIENDLLIICPTDRVFKAVYLRRKQIIRLVGKFVRFSDITIVTGNRKISFPATTNIEYVAESTMAQQDTVLTRVRPISDEDLISEVLGCSDPTSVVRFSDNLGLFSNSRIEISSGAKPNDWVGKNMADYWMGEELSKFRSRLLSDLELRNYFYTAYLFTGEKANFTVNARLVVYRGDLVRVVKCTRSEVLA